MWQPNPKFCSLLSILLSDKEIGIILVQRHKKGLQEGQKGALLCFLIPTPSPRKAITVVFPAQGQTVPPSGIFCHLQHPRNGPRDNAPELALTEKKHTFAFSGCLMQNCPGMKTKTKMWGRRRRPGLLFLKHHFLFSRAFALDQSLSKYGHFLTAIMLWNDYSDFRWGCHSDTRISSQRKCAGEGEAPKMSFTVVTCS